MVEKLALHAKIRDTKKDKAKKVRKEGMIPAVVYGKGVEPFSVMINAREFEKVFHGHIAENIFIDLIFDEDSSKNRLVFIKDFQRNPMKDEIMHIDFVEIHKGEKISTHVPLRLVGKAPGVAMGGILEHNLREILVSCLPDDLPSEIKVDISGLEVDDSIHVGDLNLGEKVKVLTPPDTVIVHIAAMKSAETEASEEEAAVGVAAEPELVKKEKTESKSE